MAQSPPPGAQDFSVSFSSNVASGVVVQAPGADPESCKVVVFDDYWAVALHGVSGADGYTVEVIVYRGYTGPGTYTGDASAGELKGGFDKHDATGTSWGGEPPAGTPGRLTIDGTGRGGSFDLTLRPIVSSPLPGDTLLHMTGTFNCPGYGPELPTEPPDETPPPQENSCSGESVVPGGALALSGPLAAPPVAQRDIDIEVAAVEVVQTVQTPEGDVPLIAGKATLVRVFVHKVTPTGGEPIGAVVSMTAKLLNGDSLVATHGDSWTNQCVLARDSIDRDEYQSNEARFWVRNPPAGQIFFDIFVRLTGGTGKDANSANNNGRAEPRFEPDPKSRVALVAVCMSMDAQRNGTECPTAGERQTITSSLNPIPMFPTNERMFEMPGDAWVFPGTGGWQRLNPFLDREQMLLEWLRSRYVLAVSGNVGAATGAPESIVGIVTASASSAAGLADPGSITGRYFSGMGHTGWVRADAIEFALPIVLGQLWGLRYDPKQPCDASATIRAPGVNPATRQFQGPGTWSFMTTCGTPVWISAEDSRTLFRNHLRTPIDQVRDGGDLGSALAMVGSGDLLSHERERARLSADAAPGYLLVSGAVTADGAAGALVPAIGVPAATPGDLATDTDAGRFCLELRGSSTAAERHCFDPDFVDRRTGDPATAAAFTLTVPVAAGVQQVALTADGRDLDVITRSAAAPAISALSHAGETWTSARDLTWTVSDPDGDAVELTVLYSPNGGDTWLPYAPDWPAGSLTIDPSELQAGNHNLFRLIASDGFNTTTADIGPISVSSDVGAELGMGGGCELERDCEPGQAPPGAGSVGPDPVVLAGLVGLVGLVVVAIFAVVALGRRRRPAYVGTAPGWVAPPPNPGFSHMVPATGLWVWPTPEAGGPASHALAPGLALNVIEWRPDGWARVVASNGTSGWVDGRLLLPQSG